MSEYLQLQRVKELPRLPLSGMIDLTYRCNDNCRHCWLRIPQDAEEKRNELAFDEIRGIVDEARGMGCRKWHISGGEPMLRPDFYEIFDYITSHSISYSINTNGTLITPKIAQSMKRKGVKMVALYGATAEVHDHITRRLGSFEATMRGFAYLRETSADFIVQIIPMRDNYHQYKDMINLAQSLGKYWRIGAPWLWLSAYGDPERNKEIIYQRLSPEDVVEFDKPDLSFQEWLNNERNENYCPINEDAYLFSACISQRYNFHIDPYGGMSFCCFIKEPQLRYNLREGNFKECWKEFIPSLANKIKANNEYHSNCGPCELRKDCRFCPVYGYLEHGRFSAKVDYLCAVAKENRKFKTDWQKNHRRYYQIADINIRVESDLPITENTFHPKFKKFEVRRQGKDCINIRHHFSLPDLDGKNLGKEVYRRLPWAVYKNGDSWIYLGFSPVQTSNRVAIFNHDYTRAMIYNYSEQTFLKGNLHSLTLFPSDQILLACILADREGCYLHSCGVNFEGKGLLFAGHSDTGKSTIATLLKDRAEILCDDRIIVRRVNGDFRIYGTWSHGDISDVSASPAPLKAILFLEKAQGNKLIFLDDKREISKKLLACLIRPFVTTEWWDKILMLVDKIADRIPCYVLQFDKSSEVVNVLRQL